MNKAELPVRVYVVVEVTAGVAENAKCFRRLEDAQELCELLRAEHDSGEDDAQVFESVME